MASSTPDTAPAAAAPFDWTGTWWIEVPVIAPGPDYITEEDINAFVEANLVGADGEPISTIVRSAAGSNVEQPNPIVLHATLYYGGKADDTMFAEVSELIQDLSLGDKFTEALAIGDDARMRLEVPFGGGHLVNMFNTENDDGVRAVVQELYAEGERRGVWKRKEKGQEVVPSKQPWTPHLTFFEHKTKDDALQHLAALRELSELTALLSKKLCFGRPILVHKLKNGNMELAEL